MHLRCERTPVRGIPLAGGVAALGFCVVLGACGGSGGGDGTPVSASGSLEVSGCTIAADAASCAGTVRWTTSNATSPRVLLDGATLEMGAGGEKSVDLDVTTRTVTLLDGSVELDRATVGGRCESASAWDASLCRAFARRSSVRATTPFVENGQPISLEVVLYTPLFAGPYPTVVFNHGSTGNGDDPALFSLTWTNEAVARFFTERGWLVAFPQRRGRGASDGLYDEGFTADRSRYSCDQAPALAGVERALQDVEAAVEYLRARPDVDATRMLSAGQSRGGVLAVAHAAIRPTLFDGAINFVGGWLGEGCGDYESVNHASFVRGASFPGPTLWLYANGDSFYGIAYSNDNFLAFTAAGGHGEFKVYTRAPGLNGHFVIDDPDLWTDDLAAFVAPLE